MTYLVTILHPQVAIQLLKKCRNVVIHSRITCHEGHRCGLRYSSNIFLTSFSRGEWMVNATPRRFTSGKAIRLALCGRLGGLMVSLEGCGKSRPKRDLINGPSSS